MVYPLVSEYIQSILLAENCFNQLSNLRPILNERGIPIFSSGNYAVVFKMIDIQSNRTYAVKCFTRNQEGRNESYGLISKELEKERSSYFVSFKYLDKELYVDSKQTPETDFPVLLMDWVEGVTLDKYIRTNLDDWFSLDMLVYRFSRLARYLVSKPFAHGDLKPDNILVKEDGALVLIDYDGMYVPAMKGQTARELGSPDFVHPERNERDFDDHIDDFALLSILLSIKALSINPDLLARFGAEERLLLSRDDYVSLAKSEFVKALFPSENKELNIIYSLFMLVYSCVPLTNELVKVFNVIDERQFYKGEGYCEGGFRTKEFFHQHFCQNIDGVEQNRALAFKLFNELALSGEKNAQCCLGCCYKKGYGTDIDLDEAIKWYKVSIENGDSRALNHLCGLAEQFYKTDKPEHDYSKAFELFEYLARYDYQKAIEILGFSYENGIGVPKIQSLAQEWYSKLHDSYYYIQIGKSYYRGKDCEQNYEKAVYWFQRALYLNNCDPKACYHLGICYDLGQGVEMNKDKAHLLFSKISPETFYATDVYEHYFETGQYEQAASWLKKYIEANKDDIHEIPWIDVQIRKLKEKGIDI